MGTQKVWPTDCSCAVVNGGNSKFGRCQMELVLLHWHSYEKGGVLRFQSVKTLFPPFLMIVVNFGMHWNHDTIMATNSTAQ